MNKKQIYVLCSSFLVLSTFTSVAHQVKMENNYKQEIEIQKKKVNNLYNTKQKLIKRNNDLIGNMKILQNSLEQTEDKLENTQNQLQKKNKENEQLRPSRGGSYKSQHRQEFTLTFYTDLECENSSAGAVNCLGERLSQGMVANNKLPLGTKIYLKGYGNYYVADRGGSSFNNNYHLDVFVPRNGGESNSQYKKRVNNMGVRKVKGYIIK